MEELKVKKTEVDDKRIKISFDKNGNILKTGFDPKTPKMYSFEVFKKWFDVHYSGDAKKVYDKLVKDSK